ncbi:MAG: hypothetical protein LBQ79_12590, partial [Deltaproteobacteria bacterium]|nr:hypothetical protein [Deltaproteobacteria bacterium]
MVLVLQNITCLHDEFDISFLSDVRSLPPPSSLSAFRLPPPSSSAYLFLRPLPPLSASTRKRDRDGQLADEEGLLASLPANANLFQLKVLVIIGSVLIIIYIYIYILLIFFSLK